MNTVMVGFLAGVSVAATMLAGCSADEVPSLALSATSSASTPGPTIARTGRVVTIPDVTGLSSVEARARFADAGLEVNLPTYEASSQRARTVVRQIPVAATVVTLPYSVGIVLSAGGRGSEPRVSFTPRPSPTECDETNDLDDNRFGRCFYVLQTT